MLKTGEIRLKAEEPVEPGPLEGVFLELVSGKPQSRVEVKTGPWDVVERSSGCVSFGGDAVEDCEALYDHV